jgi:hemerythrin superfamily protein
MANATQPRSSGKAADAVTLLKRDHRDVESLFEKFEGADGEESMSIAQQICQMLTVHAEIEEEILYPAAKEAFEEEEDLELVNEAAVEHASVKELISQIEAMTEEDELFNATVKVLSEYVKHHVKEEEEELFPKLKQTGIDLADLGAQLQERKAQVMSEVGLEDDEEQADALEDDDEDDSTLSSRSERGRGNGRPPANASGE